MSSMPSVIVKKGGFLGALATGLFTLLTTVVICASGLGFYALNVLDRRGGSILASVADGLSNGLTQWRETLPPAIVESLDDHRAIDYRTSLDTAVRLVEDDRGGCALLDVANHGDQVVTLLAARVVVEDERGVPVRQEVQYVATPLAFGNDDDWNGPLLPGSPRRLAIPLRRVEAGMKATVEITELRVWNGPKPRPEKAEASMTAARQ
ncbi:hypothetical protein RAS1_22010 [Phycisphaerae bacterium RAS1]|nr:hypothetical protein RAS1_22010 [Phycisphaerae bacterium RAS1]